MTLGAKKSSMAASFFLLKTSSYQLRTRTLFASVDVFTSVDLVTCVTIDTVPLCVVSQFFRAVSDSSSIDRGDVEWHYWRTQKQGSAEAVPVGSKRVVISLILVYIIPQYLIFVKYIKNCIFIYDKLTGERGFSVIFLRKRPTGL